MALSRPANVVSKPIDYISSLIPTPTKKKDTHPHTHPSCLAHPYSNNEKQHACIPTHPHSSVSLNKADSAGFAAITAAAAAAARRQMKRVAILVSPAREGCIVRWQMEAEPRGIERGVDSSYPSKHASLSI